ncbi:MAG TPA: PAAR domain-containing protein [Planctomycetaceae bacterium]|nr:PAAR domain-containing protein [Planctomycetaceae bacterium]
MKPAARVTDLHVCPRSTGLVPHVGGPILEGESTILIDGFLAAVSSDKCLCAGPPDTISGGSSTVNFGGKKAVRLGDSTEHGGRITSGSSSVLIGD